MHYVLYNNYVHEISVGYLVPRSVNWKRCNRETYKIQAVLERLIVLWPTRSQGRSRINIYIRVARF